MKIKEVAEVADVILDRSELLLLNAAINEICNGIDVFEFETRVGFTRSKAEGLMNEIQALLDQME